MTRNGYVRIVTNFGPLNLELFCKHAPRACENFIVHYRNGYYNNTIFHRIVSGFVVIFLIYFCYIFLFVFSFKVVILLALELVVNLFGIGHSKMNFKALINMTKGVFSAWLIEELILTVHNCILFLINYMSHFINFYLVS